jgi:hypothetical protein
MMALFLGSSQKGTFSATELSLWPVISFTGMRDWSKTGVLESVPRIQGFRIHTRTLALSPESESRAGVRGSACLVDERIGTL